jgi:hypothetical protein
MRRILLSCAILGVVMLPAAASAGAQAHPRPGFLVVRKAAGDGGVNGLPVVTVVMHGFVLGRASQEAQVAIYRLPGEDKPQAHGADVSSQGSRWGPHHLPGTVFTGSGFRFLATGGYYRVVVRGAGVYLFAGGHGHVTLRGSSINPRTDGTYSVNGAVPRSLPARTLEREIGTG